VTCPDPLCVSNRVQLDRLERENHDLRLALAESLPTVSARRDLERVNARLAEANRELLKRRKQET
jgi:hypothetical protein